MAASPGFVELILILLAGSFGGGFLGLPLSVPPLPPDPVIERSAADACLFHASLRGLARPDGASANQTERLLADDEVREFVAAFAREAGRAIDAWAARQGAGDLADDVEAVALALATRPAALTLDAVEMRPGSPPDIAASLVLHVGPQRDGFTAAVDALVAAIGGGDPGAAKPDAVTVAGKPWQRLTAGPAGPVVTWGFDGPYFIATLGAGTLDKLLERIGDAARASPAWRAAIEKRMPMDRQGTLAYVDAAAVRKLLDRDGDPGVRTFLSATGLDALDVVAAVSGMSGPGVASATWLGLRGDPQGIFAAPVGGPLAAADLAAVPADAVMAQVWKLDLSATLAAVLEGVAKADPEAANQARTSMEQFRAVAGLDPDRHLLKPLGDTWRIFLLPGGGPLVPQAAVSVRVRDRKTLERTHAALLRLLREAAANPESGIAVTVRETAYRDTTLYTLEGRPGTPLPVTPTWCITNDALTITISPQLMRTLLSRKAGDPGLAAVPEVAAAVGKDGGALLGYLEPSSLVASLCSLYEMAAGMAEPALAEQGIEIDPPQLPAMSAIAPHVRPSVSVVRRVGGEGILAESQGTVPLGPLSSGSGIVGGSPATGGVLVALLLPAVQSAREAARRAQGMNNMKQLLLAMHMHASAGGDRFPAPAIVDDAGKPLLSWRVAMLPYLEQHELYEQFRRDEPWDSDHNRRLIERMPDVFRDPGDAAAEPGMTRYVMPIGPGTLFPRPDAAPAIANIRDGTSGTIALMEVNDDHAVPWTKPVDVPPGDDVLAPLRGARTGGFLAGFADGSVRLLPGSMDAATLRALLTPDGGETVRPD